MKLIKNILSIDLESWIHFYKDATKTELRELMPSDRKRLDANYIPEATANILDLLKKYNQKATFFILGELYEWYPEVVEEIEKKGHEIGYHTHSHVRLTNSEVLEDELKRSNNFIKRFRPMGFRAPKIFITRDSMVGLKKWGFKYSSSTYDEYKIDKIEEIDEIPVSAIPFRKRNEKNQELPKDLLKMLKAGMIPFGSGLFIAFFGSRTSYFINHLNKKNIPAVLFIHPWQLYRPKEIKSLPFKIKVLSRNFLCVPYTFSILRPMEGLLKQHKFTSFKDYYYE